jgi:hypothetical protein
MQLKNSCEEIDASTQDNLDRVGIFADAMPGCACERQSLSPISPGLISDNETIVRMVCSPMHVHKKQTKLMANFFSHVATVGASAQRLDHASNHELAACIAGLVLGRDDRAWLGYVSAPAAAIRAVALRQEGEQSFCVADAALQDNPAHAEIHCAYRIPEADQIEYRHSLMMVFNADEIRHRKSLREQGVWNELPEGLQQRDLPPQWASLV